MLQTTLKPRPIAGLIEVIAGVFSDERGFMKRLYDQQAFQAAGLTTDWIQESYSFSAQAYTLRGLHVSLPPMLEGKMIIPLIGKTQWIALDLRKDSPSFGQWDSIIFDADKHNALYAAKGFAHGCLSLSEKSGLYLKADSLFQDATGIHWQDPDLAIDWHFADQTPIISDSHQLYPSFSEFKAAYGALDV